MRLGSPTGTHACSCGSWQIQTVERVPAAVVEGADASNKTRYKIRRVAAAVRRRDGSSESGSPKQVGYLLKSALARVPVTRIKLAYARVLLSVRRGMLEQMLYSSTLATDRAPT